MKSIIKNIKYVDKLIVFSEIPNEITLALNISNCPIHCEGCHSKYLWEDIGTELTSEVLEDLIDKHDGITCVCFMGGDSEPELVNLLAERVHKLGLKTCWYSGKQELSDKINLKNFEFIKLGPYIKELGGLDSKTTNQRFYEYNGLDSTIGEGWQDITYKFQDKDVL